MKRLMAAVAMGMSLVCFAGTAPAAQSGREAARELVKKSISFYKANGKDKTFSEINRAGGQFSKGELYLFVIDGTGHMLAHGTNPKLIGKSMLEVKDSEGRYFIKEFIKTAKNGSGWVDYKWTNPESKKIEEKHSYVEGAGDLVFGCGYYK